MHSRRGDYETNVIASAAAGPARHLLHLGSSQLSPAVSGARFGASQHDGTGRKINARGHGGGRKDCIEQACAHHFFDHQFPRRHVPRMMRRNGTTHDRLQMTMVANLWKLLDKAAYEIAPLIAPMIVWVTPHRRRFRCSLIAAAPRWQENDGGKQIVRAERSQQHGRRHFWQTYFHKFTCELIKALPQTKIF